MKYLRILKNNNTVSCETVRNAYNPEHVSNFSLKTVFSGRKTFSLGNRNLNLYPGTFLAINKGTVYSSRIDSDVAVENFSISFSPAFLSDFNRTQQHTHQAILDEPFTITDADHQLMETIYPFSGDMRYNIMHLKNHLENGISDDLLINEYFHHALINYYKVYNHEVLRKSENLNHLKKGTRTELLKRLSLAKEYIHSHYSHNIALEDIAGTACLSVNHFLRTFKQAYGKSPHQYLTRVRLDRAKFLLKNTAYTINEIVEIIGLECPSSFIRQFKSMFAMTPGAYRLGN